MSEILHIKYAHWVMQFFYFSRCISCWFSTGFHNHISSVKSDWHQNYTHAPRTEKVLVFENMESFIISFKSWGCTMEGQVQTRVSGSLIFWPVPPAFSDCCSIVWHQWNPVEPSFDRSGNHFPIWNFATHKTDPNLFFTAPIFVLGVQILKNMNFMTCMTACKYFIWKFGLGVQGAWPLEPDGWGLLHPNSHSFLVAEWLKVFIPSIRTSNERARLGLSMDASWQSVWSWWQENNFKFTPKSLLQSAALHPSAHPLLLIETLMNLSLHRHATHHKKEQNWSILSHICTVFVHTNHVINTNQTPAKQ